MKTLVPIVLLSVFIFGTALKLVLVRYENKRQYMELQSMRRQHDELDRERGQLLLEQGTAGAHLRVEAIAREKLSMTVPDGNQLLRVYP